MEDTIEICSGCGKMPRPIDSIGGSFVCSRCGNRSTMFVTGTDYERIVIELDEKFHQALQNKKIQEASKVPIKFKTPKTKKKPSKPKKTAKVKKGTKKKPKKSTKKKKK